jgi:CTP synthase (UTP-ammonia lyase)
LISLLACSLQAQQIEVELRPGSALRQLHQADRAVEATTCNYGLNPRLQHVAESCGMIVSAVDDTGEVRAIERPEHPFFVATLYQPQLTSTLDRPHPLFLGFLRAVTRTASLP